MDTIKTRRKDMPLAPFTFQGRVQVDINDQFGRLIFCESLLPNMIDVLDLFLFSGSGSTWIASTAFFLKNAMEGSKQKYTITGWEASREKFAMAQKNLKLFSKTIDYNLNNEFTLDRTEGECNWKRCNLEIKLPVRGSLLDYCKEKYSMGTAVSMSIHDGDVAHGLGDLHEWKVIEQYCRPTFVSLFNTNIHATHKAIVCQLSKSSAWVEVKSGWVPFERHPRYKNRTYHSFVNIERYNERYTLVEKLPNINVVAGWIKKGIFKAVQKEIHDYVVRNASRIFDSNQPAKNLKKSKETEKTLNMEVVGNEDDKTDNRKISKINRRKVIPFDNETPKAMDQNLQSEKFDIMTIMKTPTCVNYYTVVNAIKYLKQQGLNKVFVVTKRKWMKGVGQWSDDVVPIDEDNAYEGINYARVASLLNKYGWTDGEFQGRTNAGWYLVQFLNLAFVLRDDVSDILLLQDADQMILPHFKMFGKGTFKDGKNNDVPKMSIKVGGGKNNLYDYAMKCLTGIDLVFPKTGGSYVTHSWVSYRPVLEELLVEFEKSRVNKKIENKINESDVSKQLLWLENSVKCINPRSPHLGYGESANYLTWIIKRHPEMVDIENRKTWIRNLGGETGKMSLGKNGYCCPDKKYFAAADKRGYEFVGVELGHSYNKHCKYTSDEFKNSPYPPAKDDFWVKRGIQW
jgi:hypothetical protein